MLGQRDFTVELTEGLERCFEDLEAVVGTTAACRIFGHSRATLHRRRHPRPVPSSSKRAEFRHPAQLSEAERDAVLEVLCSERFADKSVAQTYTILLDEGVYMCSQSSMYRLLRAHGQSGERRAQARHPARKKPELLATGVNQVWSWDITKLRGPARGVFYQLYVIIDIYSRKVIH